MNYNDLKLRHEKKYYINLAGYHFIRSRLHLVIKSDDFTNEKNEYMIRSLYLDDFTNSCFYDKQAGILKRKKYRIRIYNGLKDNIKLEKKIKYGEYIAKVSESISYEMYQSIINKTNLSHLLTSKSTLLRELYTEIMTHGLSPKTIVDYDREVYVCDEGNVRITFDKNLRTPLTWFHDLFDLTSPTKYVIEPPRMIMEVKYDAYLPNYIKSLIQHTERDISSISKYIICRQHQHLMRGKTIL